MAEIRKKVIAIIAEQLAKPEDSITETSHFIDDLGADSLDTVELVMAFEEAFEVEIPEDAAEKIQTVNYRQYDNPELARLANEITRSAQALKE